jgi:hypothetical protein
MDRFIDGGFENYVKALWTDFKARRAALKEQLASVSDPTQRRRLFDEVDLLKDQHRKAVRHARRSLY